MPDRRSPTAAARSQNEQDDLRREIELLREMIRRVGALAGENDNLQVALRLLEGISQAGGRLANMIKVQQALQAGPQGAPLSEELEKILDEIQRPR